MVLLMVLSGTDEFYLLQLKQLFGLSTLFVDISWFLGMLGTTNKA